MATLTFTGAEEGQALTKVYILYTGGTIGMAPKEEARPGSPLTPQPIGDLLNYIPNTLKRLTDLKIRFAYETLDPPQDSSNLGLEHWAEMARKIEAVYKDFDGFVILHGTDTMCYTSSAMAFMFENLAKPVVITGSQLPVSAFRTDAISNFENAMSVAGYKATALPCIPEVVIVFADKVLRGCRARKVSSSSWTGFDSPNCLPLGTIGEHIRIDTDRLRPGPASGQRFQVITDLSDKVMDISLFPGFKPSQLEKILELDVDGIVLRTFGAGNAPDRPAFLEVIKKFEDKKTIVNVTQCLEGMVEMGLYAASSGLLERGVISALDMTPEAALTKLMWSLGTKLGKQVVTQMQVSARGEQSENLFDLRYEKSGNSDEPVDRFDGFRTPDRRFSVDRLTRAVVRFSNLGIVNSSPDSAPEIRVFMNLPSANAETDPDHPRCVAKFPIAWDGQTLNPIREIDNTKARSSIGEGDISLTVVASPGCKFWFSGLYLALFAEA